MHVQIVTFNLNGISDAQYRQACDEQFVPAISSTPGLISKLWLSDPAANTYGGVYAWQDRQAMENFMNSDLFKSVASNPGLANITSKDFDVLEGPTRVTSDLQTATTGAA